MGAEAMGCVGEHTGCMHHGGFMACAAVRQDAGTRLPVIPFTSIICIGCFSSVQQTLPLSRQCKANAVPAGSIPSNSQKLGPGLPVADCNLRCTCSGRWRGRHTHLHHCSLHGNWCNRCAAAMTHPWHGKHVLNKTPRPSSTQRSDLLSPVLLPCMLPIHNMRTLP
jgi:hypothetical protein